MVFVSISRTRGMATGLTAALSYVLSFIATKTYYNLETTLSMPGVALFNCVVIAGGLILMYKILPETENRSLEDIELHFADNSKKLTHRNIPKATKRKSQNDPDPAENSSRSSEVSAPQNGCDNHGFAGQH